MYLKSLFENMLQSINNDYLLNTEPMQVGIDRNFYENYIQKSKQIYIITRYHF